MYRSVVLAGQRLALVEMTEADQQFFCSWLQNAELRALIDDHRIPTMADQMRWFARVQEPDRRFFSLVTLPDEHLIGNAGFVDIDLTRREATLRITIGDPESVGKGYGGEAVGLLVKFAFHEAGWKRILLKVLATNHRAIRVYQKAGFTLLHDDVQDGKIIHIMQLCAL